MTIVASNSLTVSKVNDGTITHTAWAYSADGADRFTTVYPNLNLLKGTKTTKSITGNNTVNQGGLLYSFDNNSTLNNQGFSINDTVTLEFDWSATNPASGTFILQWQGQPWGFSVPTINLSSTNGSGHVKYTFNIRAVDIASTAVATGIGYRLDNIPTNTVITFSNAIISKTKASQPYMQSASEVTTADWPKYIGHYMDFMQADSTNPSDYTWGPMRGDDGERGKQIFKSNYESVPHNAGHYWSDLSPAPSIDNPPKIGDTVITPSGNILQIDTVNVGGGGGGGTFGVGDVLGNIKGPSGSDGIAGKDGVGVKTTVITYAISTSGTTAPTTGWTSSVPSLVKGQYLWTKTAWTYTDNSSEIGYSVTYISKDGNNGTDGIAGKDGVGIKTTTITYAGSTSGTTAPTSGWTAAVPTVAAGSYLWTKTVWAYTDNTSETGYSVARMGLKGDKGDPGIKGSDGTSGIIVSSVAPTSPKTGQLWQDTSTTPQIVKKWTGSSWVIWKMYVENMVVDTISSMSSDLGNMIGGTLKLMDDISVNGTLKKFGLYQSKLGLLSSGPTLATTSTLSNTQMGVANLNKGELRFMVTDYTENLKDVQDAGMSDQNHAFIKFDSYDNGKDIMTIGSSGDIVFKGNTSQDTQWVTLSSGVKYKFMFSRVYISVNVVGNGNQFMQFGILPQNLRPTSDLFLIIANWGTGTADDRHIMVRASDGAVVLWAPKSGVTYSGEVSFTL